MDVAVLDSLFRFKVGDWVRPRQSPDHQPLLVVERSIHQGAGGADLYYYTHGYEPNGGLGHTKICFGELELEPADPPIRSGNVAKMARMMDAFDEVMRQHEKKHKED